MIRRRRPQRSRRALATAEAVTIAVTIGVLGVAAFVVTPRLLEGGMGRDDAIVVPRYEQNRATALSLLEALHRCKAVLAVHDRIASPVLDIVLWADDENEPNVVNESEIVVLSHSRLLQTLTMHHLQTTSPRGERALSLAEVRDPQFALDWRLRADVEGRVIGSRIAEVRFTPSAQGDSRQAAQTDGKRSGYLLELTWAAEQADEPDVARALVRLPGVKSP